MESETFFLFSFSGLIWKKAERVLKLHEGSSFGWFTGAWIELGKKPSSTRCLRTAVWERCASAHAYGLPWVAVGLRTRRRVFLQEDLSLPSYSWAYRFLHSLAGSRELRRQPERPGTGPRPVGGGVPAPSSCVRGGPGRAAPRLPWRSGGGGPGDRGRPAALPPPPWPPSPERAAAPRLRRRGGRLRGKDAPGRAGALRSALGSGSCALRA